LIADARWHDCFDDLADRAQVILTDPFGEFEQRGVDQGLGVDDIGDWFKLGGVNRCGLGVLRAD